MRKRKSEKIHALRRALQRYRVSLTSTEYESLCKQVLVGESEFIKKISNTRTMHKVSYKEISMRCIYDKKRACIVTFL